MFLLFRYHGMETIKADAQLGDILSGELTLWQKCKHRICLVKCIYGLSPNPFTNRKSKNRRIFSSYSCSCFSFCRYIHFREICSRKMNSICSRYAVNPQKLDFTRFGEPQPLELDILSLRTNSIWDKSLSLLTYIAVGDVCKSISSASAHIERRMRISKIP